jgi:hypothetical protein
MTTLTKDPIKLAKALELARLDPKERFDKTKITTIHEGLTPYYRELTGYELEEGDIVIGYVGFDGIKVEWIDIGVVIKAKEPWNLYGTLYTICRSEAEARGWIDPMPKPKFKGTLAECAKYCFNRLQGSTFEFGSWRARITDYGWIHFDMNKICKECLSDEWEEVSND